MSDLHSVRCYCGFVYSRGTGSERIAMARILAGLATVLCAVAADGVPPEWTSDASVQSLLYVASDVGLPSSQMPAIGNGYLATQIGGDAIYVSGLFNGLATEAPSHHARIPSTINFRAPGTASHAALNLREATYYRRSYIPPYKDAW